MFDDPILWLGIVAGQILVASSIASLFKPQHRPLRGLAWLFCTGALLLAAGLSLGQLLGVPLGDNRVQAQEHVLGLELGHVHTIGEAPDLIEMRPHLWVAVGLVVFLAVKRSVMERFVKSLRVGAGLDDPPIPVPDASGSNTQVEEDADPIVKSFAVSERVSPAIHLGGHHAEHRGNRLL